MGNSILADDAVGIRLARDLERRLAGTPDLAVEPECSVGGLNLLDVLAGYERVIVIDSIRTAGGVPGSWYRFNAGALKETLNLGNVHDVNFATALELGRRMGVALPRDEEIHVFAVEIQENLTLSESLTGPVAAAYPACLEGIYGAVKEILAGQPRPYSEP